MLRECDWRLRRGLVGSMSKLREHLEEGDIGSLCSSAKSYKSDKHGVFGLSSPPSAATVTTTRGISEMVELKNHEAHPCKV